MPRPVWERGDISYGMCKWHHQNFERACAGASGVNFCAVWDEDAGTTLASPELHFPFPFPKLIRTRTTSLRNLCEFVFQVFVFAVNMWSVCAPANLLLICYITLMLVAPPCAGQGKVTWSRLQGPWKSPLSDQASNNFTFMLSRKPKIGCARN